MALIAATRIASTATTVTAAAATVSNTIARGDIPASGVILGITNGAGASITVTLEDPGTTALGNAGTETGQTVPAGGTRHFRILPAHVADATGVATVTLSSATSITYTLIK
jgi:hypothetical protein